MGERKFAVIAAILLVIFASIAWAEQDVVEIKVKKNQVIIGEKAVFELTLHNNATQKQRYSIYSLQSGQGWNVDPYPFKDKIIELGPGSSYTTTIHAEAVDPDFSPGIYYVYITVAGDLGETYNGALKIYLSPENPMDYLPSIKASVDMNDKINPKEPVSIKFFLENKNPLNMLGLKIKVQSDMTEFAKELSVDLPSLEKKTVELSIAPSPFQQPKEYVLFFVFEYKGEVVKVLEKKIEIISLLPEFKTELSTDKQFLKQNNKLTVTNEGNVKNTQTVKTPISLLGSIFASGESKVLKTEGQYYFTWEVTLSPNESSTIDFMVNYRILAYILILMILLVSFYVYVQTPVKIIKTAATARMVDDEALSEVKVTLEVKNKSKKPQKEIIITDLVPGIANVEKELELGTLKPDEVKHTKQGTKVIWSIPELDSYEHRLITYKVKAKLNIIGTFSLPRATVEYKIGKNRKGKAYSNMFSLNN